MVSIYELQVTSTKTVDIVRPEQIQVIQKVKCSGIIAVFASPCIKVEVIFNNIIKLLWSNAITFVNVLKNA